MLDLLALVRLSQLGGKIDYDWRRSDLKLTMTIPLHRLELRR